MEKSLKYRYVVLLSSFFNRLSTKKKNKKKNNELTKTLTKEKEKLRWFVYLLLKTQF